MISDPPTKSNSYGERLRFAMNLAGFNGSQLAQGIGVSKQTISQVLVSQTRRLDMQHSVAAAKLLSVPLDWLDGHVDSFVATDNRLVAQKSVQQPILPTSAVAVIERLQTVFGVKTPTALARSMRVKISTLHGWLSRGRVPYKECVDIAQARGLSLDWLLAGNGPQLRESLTVAETCEEAELLRMYRLLTEEDQKYVQTKVKDLQRLQDIKRRLAVLESYFQV